MLKLQRKRLQIQEEFEQLCKEYIDNQRPLPKLKKRVIRRQEATNKRQTPRTSQLDDSSRHFTEIDTHKDDGPKNAENDNITELGSKSAGRSSEGFGDTYIICGTTGLLSSYSDSVTTRNPAVDRYMDIPSHEMTRAGICPNNINELGDRTIVESPRADEIFMYHKARLRSTSRSTTRTYDFNLDVLWSIRAKRWLMSDVTDGSQKEQPPFLNRNVRRGRIFFKRKAGVNVSKQQVTESTSCNPDQKGTLSQGMSRVLVENSEESRSKPVITRCRNRLSKKSNQVKRITATPHREDPTGDIPPRAQVKTPRLRKAKEKPVWVQKQVWKDVKPTTVAASRKAWAKSAAKDRKVAVCRPNAKRKSPSQAMLAKSPKKDSPIKEQSTGAKQSDSYGKASGAKNVTSTTTTAGAEDWLPLFSGEDNHCGGVWKSIVKEC